MNNLFFFSGPHGSGKTTLAEKLQAEMPELLLPELETKTPKFYQSSENIDFFHRQALKHAQKAIETYECEQLAMKNPERIVLGNRCIYDTLAYDSAYAERGWIGEEERQMLAGLDLLVADKNPNAIILNPGYEKVKMHLAKRWEKHRKKFMEEDMDYLRAVCLAYEQYREKPNVLYLNHAVDDLREVKEIASWLRRK